MTSISDILGRAVVRFSGNCLSLGRVNVKGAMVHLVTDITLRNIAASFWCLAQSGDRTPVRVGSPLRAHCKPPMHPTVPFAEKFGKKQQRVE